MNKTIPEDKCPYIYIYNIIYRYIYIINVDIIYIYTCMTKIIYYIYTKRGILHFFTPIDSPFDFRAHDEA